MGYLRRLLPSTIPGHIAVLVLIAVVAVVAMGSVVDTLRDSGYWEVEDIDDIVDQTVLIAEIVAPASQEQRRWIVERARASGLDLRLTDKATLDAQAAASPPLSALAVALAWLFPHDGNLPPASDWIVIDGRAGFFVPVDPDTMLVVGNLPDTLATSDFATRITYYVLAFVTLLLFLWAYAAKAIIQPLSRIVHEVDRTDGIAEERRIPERGTVELLKLARALNAMRERIGGLIEMRMRMLRSVSHDLRTPLTRMRLRAERLEDEATRQSMLADIERIDALVAGTLNYLRLDAHGEDEERVDLSSLLQTIQADFADVGFDVRFSGPDRLVCACRPNALARAVTNLCDNAVKFGKVVEISLGRTSGGVQIDVGDDGPGIAPDQRDRVLEPFYRIESARPQDDRSGFGLGHSIVADIMRAHGGSVEFHDRIPHGVTVRLLLPCR